MAKKNEFVFTIQFNPNNPIHQKTVQYLNQLSHKKADYIAQAIAAYQETAAKHSLSPFSSDKALKEYIYLAVCYLHNNAVRLMMSFRFYFVNFYKIFTP